MSQTNKGQEVLEVENDGSDVYSSQMFPLVFHSQGFLGEREEFLLFASLFEVTMIDPSVGTRPLSFELSIGKQTFCMNTAVPGTANTESLKKRPCSQCVTSMQ